MAAFLANFMVVACDNPTAPSEMGEGTHIESGSESGESGAG